MNDTQESLDLTVLEHLDFQLRCQARSHVTGAWGHVPEQAASWVVTAPCGASQMMCDGWVLSWAADPIPLDCVGGGVGCGGVHPYAEVRKIPI